MRYASISEAGGREINEDSIMVKKIDDVCCFLVADGLGGMKGGQMASNIAADTILEAFKVNPEVSYEALYSCILTAYNKLIKLKQENSEFSKMSTTIVMLITDGKKAIWGHLGDSRLYRFEKKKLREVTDDHSVAFASYIAGEGTYDDIRFSPDQNKLTRSLGNVDKFNPDISEIITCHKKTAFLLCSDGFWELVDEYTMEKTLKRAKRTRTWLNGMLKELDNNVFDGHDNYSAIAIMF